MFTKLGLRALRKSQIVLRLPFMEYSSFPEIKNLNVVRTVEKTIDSNTTETIFIESPIHVKVQPIDVDNISDHNKLTMQLYSKGKDTTDFQVKQNSKRLELLNKNAESERSDVCLIHVPYQLKVHVTTTDDASVHMSKLEGDEFVVKTQKGHINLSNIKSKNIKIESDEGEVRTEGRIQAAMIELKTGQSSGISCNNIMANTFYATTHSGTIKVNSCYSEKSHFVTALGNVLLSRLHQYVVVDIIQKGNLHITNFDGNLQATLKSGEVHMHASKLFRKTKIFIHEKGRVAILIPEIIKNLPATNLIAEKIQVDDAILKLGRFMDDSHPKRFRYGGEDNNELHIVCKNGSIELKETKEPFML